MYLCSSIKGVLPCGQGESSKLRLAFLVEDGTETLPQHRSKLQNMFRFRINLYCALLYKLKRNNKILKQEDAKHLASIEDEV